jgi:hypothetical protein
MMHELPRPRATAARHVSGVLASAVGVALLTGVSCVSAEDTPTKPPREPMLLTMRLTVKLELKSGVSRNGDPVLFEVAGDVRGTTNQRSPDRGPLCADY